MLKLFFDKQQSGAVTTQSPVVTVRLPGVLGGCFELWR